MTHVVEQLGDRIVAALNGVSEVGFAWSQRRFWPAERGTAADGIVHADGENVVPFAMGPLTYEREVDVTIAVRLTGDADGLEARGWVAQTAIETAIETDEALAAFVHAMLLRGSETQTDGSGAQAQLTRMLTYRAIVHTMATDPETKV